MNCGVFGNDSGESKEKKQEQSCWFVLKTKLAASLDNGTNLQGRSKKGPSQIETSNVITIFSSLKTPL